MRGDDCTCMENACKQRSGGCEGNACRDGLSGGRKRSNTWLQFEDSNAKQKQQQIDTLFCKQKTNFPRKTHASSGSLVG